MGRIFVWFGIIGLAAVVFAGISLSQTAVSIEGVVNDDYQLVTENGETYELGVDEESEKLAEEVNKKVSVKCVVTTDDYGTKTIKVLSYNVIGEAKPVETEE